MTYSIIWSESAARQLRKLDRSISKRIFERVQRLESEPLGQVRRLVGVPYYRLRVGEYRVIVEILHERVVILVLKVGHPSSVHSD
jgi:mRNA interferase RelE/StbE